MDRSQQNENSLYDEDFYGWTQQQAELLRDGRFDQADLANIVEEIETLGRSELSALRSRYAVLCAHLLKRIVQPTRKSRSWALTIAEQRIQIARLIADNPGFKPKRDAIFLEGYADARKLAAADTNLPIASLPPTPPFSREQAEADDWAPTPPRP